MEQPPGFVLALLRCRSGGLSLDPVHVCCCSREAPVPVRSPSFLLLQLLLEHGSDSSSSVQEE